VEHCFSEVSPPFYQARPSHPEITRKQAPAPPKNPISQYARTVYTAWKAGSVKVAMSKNQRLKRKPNNTPTNIIKERCAGQALVNPEYRVTKKRNNNNHGRSALATAGC